MPEYILENCDSLEYLTFIFHEFTYFAVDSISFNGLDLFSVDFIAHNPKYVIMPKNMWSNDLAYEVVFLELIDEVLLRVVYFQLFWLQLFTLIFLDIFNLKCLQLESQGRIVFKPNKLFFGAEFPYLLILALVELLESFFVFFISGIRIKVLFI